MRKINILIILLIISVSGVYGYTLVEPTFQQFLSNVLCVNCTLDNPNFVNYSFNGSGNSSYNYSYYYNSTENHAALSNLSWSVSGHNIDTNINMNGKNVINVSRINTTGTAYFGTSANNVRVRTSDISMNYGAKQFGIDSGGFFLTAVGGNKALVSSVGSYINGIDGITQDLSVLSSDGITVMTLSFDRGILVSVG